MTEQPEILPCGCIVGERLCPEAEALWQGVAAAYNYAKQQNTESAWWAYDQARHEYEVHVCPYDVDAGDGWEYGEEAEQ